MDKHSAFIIDGRQHALKIEQKCKSFISKEINQNLRLDVLLIGHNPPSELYVRKKVEACERIGIAGKIHRFDETISQEDLVSHIQKLNKNKDVHGILVQLPLPAHICKQKIQLAIDPLKDVDGFHIDNIGKLASEIKQGLFPCTPQGCLYLIKQIYPDITGKNTLVIGRSMIVGLPMFHLLLQENATVTIAHIKTKNLKSLTQQAEIIVSATGHPGLLGADDVSENAVIIDVGINRVVAPDQTTSKITGDVLFDEVSQKVKAITPVPGGVGPMTIAFLLVNTIKAFLLQNADPRFESFNV